MHRRVGRPRAPGPCLCAGSWLSGTRISEPCERWLHGHAVIHHRDFRWRDSGIQQSAFHKPGHGNVVRGAAVLPPRDRIRLNGKRHATRNDQPRGAGEGGRRVRPRIVRVHDVGRARPPGDRRARSIRALPIRGAAPQPRAAIPRAPATYFRGPLSRRPSIRRNTCHWPPRISAPESRWRIRMISARGRMRLPSTSQLMFRALAYFRKV